MRFEVLTVVVGVLVAGTADAQSKLGKAAVLDVQLTEFDTKLAPLFTEVVTSEVHASGRFESVVGGRDIAAMLDFEGQKQMLGCSDTTCLAEIGGALGVDRLIAAHVGKVGESIVVNVKQIDIVAAQPEARALRTLESAKAEDVLAALRACVQELLQVPGRSASGRVWPWVFWGGGVAVGVVAVAFGLDARSKHTSATDFDVPGAQTAIAPGRRSQTIATVAYGLSAASLVAGTLIWFLADEPDVTASVQVSDSSASLSVGGRF